MNYYILDTHTLVWFIENNPKLSQKAKDAILDSKSKIGFLKTWFGRG